MVNGMTVEKITISLPKETVAKARGAIRRGRAKSMSAYIAKAVQQQTDDDDLLAMLDEILEKSGGPMTPTEIRHADRVLAAPKPSRRRKR
jgi:Arc/MetJ-type ribon-helix-helix transcriptional regulator